MSIAGRKGIVGAVLATLVAALLGDGQRVLATSNEPAQLNVVVGLLRNWPPQYTQDDDGSPAGFAVDVMNQVAERANVRVRYRQFETFVEMQRALAEGSIDVIPNYGITAERESIAAFTPPVETFSLGVFVRARSTGLRSVSDLGGHAVATVESNASRLLLARVGIEAVVYPDIAPALFDLLAGQVDAFAYPSSVVWARARQAGVADRLREIGPPLAEIKRAIAVRPDDTELHARLSAAVEAFVGTPAYQQIYRRWYGRAPPFWTVRKVLWVTAIALAVLLLSVAVWRYRVVTAHNRELRAHMAQRDAAQAALAAGEAKYRQIVETAHEGVWMIDTDAITTFVNRRMAEMLGLSPEQMIGRPMSDFFDGALGEEAAMNLKRQGEGRAEVYDLGLRRADGAELHVVLATTPILVDGEFQGSLAMVSDVTERRRLALELRQSQRLEALGRLAGGIAHDFNNLLFVITAALDLAQASLAKGMPIHLELADISDATARASALTSQLLAFSRRQRKSPQVLYPAESIADATPLLRRLLGEEIALELPTPGASGAVEIDPSQLDQLVFNLVSNARDAMPDGGRLVISVEDRTVTSDSAMADGDYVVIEVTDDGAGIPADVLPNVFDPFFTTKSEGRGTGLGLATCYGIAVQAGGHIAVSSEPGVGTRFSVFLPRVSAPLERPAQRDIAPSEPARGLTILVVDDEPMARRLVRRILDGSDHVIYDAGTPDEALRLCREHIADLDVLLTDVRMPGMNGPELAHRCLEIAPDLRVVYMSGDTGRALDGFDERDTFLAKPFTRTQLLSAIGAGNPV